MMRRHPVISITVWLFMLLMGFSGCGDSPADSKNGKPVNETKSEKKARQVNVRMVEAHPPMGTVEYVGRLEAFLKVRVSSEIGGMIEKLNFEKGDRVQKGDLLAEIGTRSIRLQVREAKAARKAAESHLKKLEKGSRPQEIEIAEAALKEAEAALSEARNNFERIDKLHKIRAVSNSAFDAAQRQRITANARMESARQRLALAKQGPRVEDIMTARAQLAQAEASVALVEDRLEKSIVMAPISGIIAYREVEAGEVISAGTSITTVIQLDRLKIEIALNEKDIHILEKQKTFDFTVDAIPGETFSSQVFFLSPTTESSTRFFPLELIVANSDPRMADGMTARVIFPLVTQKNFMKIPASWLAEENGKVGLFVAKDGKAHFKPVRLGAYYDNRVEILEGLADKDRVIINPSGLRSGDPVDIRK